MVDEKSLLDSKQMASFVADGYLRFDELVSEDIERSRLRRDGGWRHHREGKWNRSRRGMVRKFGCRGHLPST